jgi:hypothetical protein
MEVSIKFYIIVMKHWQQESWIFFHTKRSSVVDKAYSTVFRLYRIKKTQCAQFRDALYMYAKDFSLSTVY